MEQKIRAFMASWRVKPRKQFFDCLLAVIYLTLATVPEIQQYWWAVLFCGFACGWKLGDALFTEYKQVTDKLMDVSREMIDLQKEQLEIADKLIESQETMIASQTRQLEERLKSGRNV